MLPLVVYNGSTLPAARPREIAMPESHDVRNMLAMAESAAAAGDLASADELLRSVARAQEDELGPLHPDLASTLNNLAIIAEKTDRPDEAEKFYRRAVAITSASLPADDPRLVASRQNLEEFCRARGLPIDEPAVIVAPPPPPPHIEPVQSSAVVDPLPAPLVPPPTTVRHPSRSLVIMAIAAVILVTLLVVMKPWSSRETPAPVPASAPSTAAPQAPPAADPVPPPTAAPTPVQRTEPPTAARRDNDRSVSGGKPAISLASAQVCRTFSPRGADWKCDPAGDSVAPGQMALYTRVKSPRDTVVVHRWYRGTTLRQAVRLNVRASATEGYRTYSRQTVHPGEEWRVEVRNVAGDLLYERNLAVR